MPAPYLLVDYSSCQTDYFEGDSFSASGATYTVRLPNGNIIHPFSVPFTPNGPLSFYDEQIDFCFSFGELELHCYVPIRVWVSSQMTSLSVNKNYDQYAGETIKDDMLTIVASFSNGETRDVPLSRCSVTINGLSTNVLSLGSNVINVTFHHRGVTLTQSITVTCYNLPSNISTSSSPFDNPKWCLATSSLFYSCPIVNFNPNGHPLNVSITYHSQTYIYITNKYSELPAGWTLSIKQFVINDNGIYKYFNELGEVISFESIDSSTYYDIRGYGYLLTIDNNLITISKTDGTKYLFNSDGYLYQINKFGNNGLKLMIVYQTNNTDLIDRIYYNNHPATYLLFEYSNSGKLIKVHTYSDSQLVNTTNIGYSSSKISSISEVGDNPNNSPLSLLTFSYANNLLQIVNNSLTNERIEFVYDNFRPGTSFPKSYYLVGINKGVYHNNSFDIQSSLNKDSLFITNNYPEIIYLYVLTNEKNINICYFIDKNQNIASSFERISSNNYKSLEPNDGISISVSGSTPSSTLTMNGWGSYNFNSQKTLSCSTAISELVTFISGSTDCNLGLTFYYWLNNTTNDVYAKLQVGSTYYYKQLNNIKGYCLQKVTIPFTCTSANQTIKLSFINVLNQIVETKVIDPVINYVTEQSIIYKNNSTIKYLDGVTRVKLTDFSTTTYPCYFTFKDFVLTANHLYRNISSPKLFYCCNGQKAYQYINTSNVLIYLSGNDYITLENLLSNFYIFNQRKIFKAGDDDEHDDDLDIISYVNYTQYFFDYNQLTVTSINDNSNSQTSQANTVTTIKKYNVFYQLLEESKSETYQNINFFSYKIKRLYNSYGDVTVVKKVNLDETSELIVNQYAYDDDGCVISEDGPISGVYINYNGNKNPTSIHPRIFSSGAFSTLTNITHSSTYDSYYRLLSSQFSSNNVQIESNNNTYNSRGLIEDTLNNSTNGYRFTYSDDLLTNHYYSINNNTPVLLETSSKTLSSTDTTNETSWTISSLNHTLTNIQNKYNRLYSIGFDGEEDGFSFTYINKKESPYSNKSLSSIYRQGAYQSNFAYYDNKSINYECIFTSGSPLLKKDYSRGGNLTYRIFTTNLDFPRDHSTAVYYSPSQFGLDETKNYIDDAEINQSSNVYNYDVFFRLTRKTNTYYSNTDYLNEYRYAYYVKNNRETELISNQTYFGLKNNNNQYIYKLNDSITYNDRVCISSISSIKTINGSDTTTNYTFNYDDVLRISSSIITSLRSVTYQYDSSGLLSTEIDTITNRSKSFFYNSSFFGQISSISVNQVSPSQLIDSYSFTYDELGNRISKTMNSSLVTNYSYYYHFLNNISIDNNSKNVGFDYGPDGIRYRKEVNENNSITTTNYIYDGTKLIALSSGDWRLIFLYDIHGVCGFKVITHPSSVSNTDTVFTYIRNELGDIVSILDESGNEVISYTYDEWGNILSSNPSSYGYYYLLKQVNPFRYRGYVYDEETGLYYLNSRYYDPFTHTFLTIDDYQYLNISNITGVNLYCYCNYNPVMYKDENGNFAFSSLLIAAGIGALAGAIVGGAFGAITAKATGGDVWTGAAAGAIGGAIMGAGAAIGSAFLTPIFAGTIVNGTVTVFGLGMSIKTACVAGLLSSAVSGFAGNFVSSLITQKDPTKAAISGAYGLIINTVSSLFGGFIGPESTNLISLISSTFTGVNSAGLSSVIDLIVYFLGEKNE